MTQDPISSIHRQAGTPNGIPTTRRSDAMRPRESLGFGAKIRARGKAVIVAHAASYAIGHSDGVLRVLVTASPETRTTRVAEAEGLDQAGAARALKESDAGRADYLKRFYDVRDESPTHYDLVLNTDALSIQQAADLIARGAA